jgi:hypothetical protein
MLPLNKAQAAPGLLARRERSTDATDLVKSVRLSENLRVPVPAGCGPAELADGVNQGVKHLPS